MIYSVEKIFDKRTTKSSQINSSSTWVERCAQIRRDTELSRGLSASERKRTCIEIELVLQQKILFYWYCFLECFFFM